MHIPKQSFPPSHDNHPDGSKVFLASGSNIEVEVADLYRDSNGTHTTRSTYVNEQAFQIICNEDEAAHPICRFIFFHQKNALRPLGITYALLKVIVDHYEISQCVYDLAQCFESRSESSWEAYCPSLQVNESETAQGLSYSYKYAAHKPGKFEYPWVIRQTGVCHTYDKKNKRSLWLIMNSNSEFGAKKLIVQSLSNVEFRTQIGNRPFWLHTALMTNNISSWSGYCKYYEASLEEIYNDVATTELNSPQFLHHGMTLKTSALEKRFLPLQSIFQSWKRLLDGLHSLEWSHFSEEEAQVIATSRNLRDEISAHAEHSSYVLDLARSVRQQISDTLSLKNQHVSQETNNGVATLSRHTASDSRAIRNITIVTLFYLPFSFVATFMGMNFFVMDEDSREVIVSRRLWLYFVASVPLTILTIFFSKRGTLRVLWRRMRYVTRIDEERAVDHDLTVLTPP